MTSQTATGQEFYLITGIYTRTADEKGIYVHRFNSETGELTPVSEASGESPTYLTAAKDASHVYCVHENGGDKPGEVSSFSFDRTNGKLQLINTLPSGGDHPCHISVDATNKWVVVGNYTGGNFSVYPIRNDGGLGEMVQLIRHEGHSVDASRQDKPYVHAVTFTPDNLFLVVVDLGIDKLMIYPFDASKEKPVGETPTAVNTDPGSGPRHIVFHPSLPFAYTIEEMAGNISACTYKNGGLGHIQTINSHPADFNGEIGSAAIRISPDGLFLYASNRGASHTISIHAIDQSTGTLSPKGYPSSGGTIPRDFIIDPTGKFLLTGNSGTNTIIVFRRDQQTGLLEQTGKQAEVSQPVVFAFVDILAK